MPRPGPLAKMPRKKLIAAAYEYADRAELPSVIRFAHDVGYAKSRLYAIAEKDEEMRAALDYIIESREEALANGGLRGTFTQSVSIFCLKQLGWSDRQEIELGKETRQTMAAANMTMSEKRKLLKEAATLYSEGAGKASDDNGEGEKQ